MPAFLASEVIPFLRNILAFSRKRKERLFIVGGFLRDALLGKPKEPFDVDFCIKDQAIAFGRLLSRKLKAGFVVLDKENGSCRLVKKDRGKVYTFDFTDFRGDSLREDLLLRDFTINTLALDLETAISAKDPALFLIDFYNARGDLENKIIRLVNERAFDDDPLRILRLFSLSCTLGFAIDKRTLAIAKEKRRKLSSVSMERVRDELFKILHSGCAYDSLLKLDKLGILKLIVPEIEVMRGVKQGPYHHLDVLKHSLETLRQLELLIKDISGSKDMDDYLHEPISGARQRFALLKLSALLHDIGKPAARRRQGRKIKFYGHERAGARIASVIARRLKLSNQELDALNKMVFWHLRPGYLGDSLSPTPRARFRYFRDTGREAASVLMLSLADQRSTLGPLTTKASRVMHEKVVSGMIKEYFHKAKEKQMTPLINGDHLIKELKLKPSPVFGKILRELEELQAIGKIKTKTEGLLAARKILKSLKREKKK